MKKNIEITEFNHQTGGEIGKIILDWFLSNEEALVLTIKKKQPGNVLEINVSDGLMVKGGLV